MIRRASRGLRGRLLLAFVATSAVTLAVAAAITLSPLQERLRSESASVLQDAAEGMRSEFNTALVRAGRNKAKQPKDWTEEELRVRGDKASELVSPTFELRQRTGGARVLVADLSWTNRLGDEYPAFLYDTDFQSDQTGALALAYRAVRENQSEVEFVDDDLRFAMPLYDEEAKVIGVLVAERNLNEVTTAVKLVRNALFTAAAIGLAVAIGLGLALSSTLTRRLGRLRRAALRITEEGPEAPAPTDHGRDEVGDLARALARMQEELRRQEAARRAFVSTASHELRTPLTMLQGTMELLDEDLRDGGDLTDAQEQVASARGELRRLSVLASELLDLSRLDAAVQLRSEPV
ncbi:MAG TPA: HAMP domain-containing sensor histidine kinase, partial [Solirubrobacter sp.]|nr:HAMP domain-containing sensor histidine kinase [Solirubrobacter sp.]